MSESESEDRMCDESEDTTIEWVDRYGGDYPDPDTMCKGQCDGMGVYPEDNGEFVTCADCNGTGKAITA